MFKNICERYGDKVQVTIEDYKELNPDGNFQQLEDEIIEIFSDKAGDWELIATKED